MVHEQVKSLTREERLDLTNLRNQAFFWLLDENSPDFDQPTTLEVSPFKAARERYGRSLEDPNMYTMRQNIMLGNSHDALYLRGTRYGGENLYRIDNIVHAAKAFLATLKLIQSQTIDYFVDHNGQATHDDFQYDMFNKNIPYTDRERVDMVFANCDSGKVSLGRSGWEAFMLLEEFGIDDDYSSRERWGFTVSYLKFTKG